MSQKILFSELRKVKNSLPKGATRQIAQELGIHTATVKNYFGAKDFNNGACVGTHREQGFGNGVVVLHDTQILEMAYAIIRNRLQIQEFSA